ncbi:MAG TPA: hypothetical protein VFS77_20795, partial [Pyrinomonadaceae bacterium]|nr:hypothetical protein [Pyrinomonadaceae bacterium]
PQQGLAQVDRTAYVNATIALRNGKIESASDWITDRALSAENLNVSIAPGAVAIVEIRVSPQR